MKVDMYQCELCEDKLEAREVGLSFDIGDKDRFDIVPIDVADTHICKWCVIGLAVLLKEKDERRTSSVIQLDRKPNQQ